MRYPKLQTTHMFKALAVVVTIIIMVFAIVSLINSQHTKEIQARQAQASVANHTQTLNEIKKAVSTLEASNKADHAQTVQYINCVLVGITNATSPTAAQVTYKSCLADSGITQ
jgi:hypothetical protein